MQKVERLSEFLFNEVSSETMKNGRDRLVITSIPYQVNKSVLNERIAQLVREKKIEGIKDIRDESNREGIRVAIDLRSGGEPETIKRQLYKNTQIESSFGFNTLAIVEGKPKTCNLKDFLTSFLSFREDIVIKKTKISPDYINVGGGFPSIYPDLIPQSLKKYFEEIKKNIATGLKTIL